MPDSVLSFLDIQVFTCPMTNNAGELSKVTQQMVELDLKFGGQILEPTLLTTSPDGCSRLTFLGCEVSFITN